MENWMSAPFRFVVFGGQSLESRAVYNRPHLFQELKTLVTCCGVFCCGCLPPSDGQFPASELFRELVVESRLLLIMPPTL